MGTTGEASVYFEAVHYLKVTTPNWMGTAGQISMNANWQAWAAETFPLSTSSETSNSQYSMFFTYQKIVNEQPVQRVGLRIRDSSKGPIFNGTVEAYESALVLNTAYSLTARAYGSGGGFSNDFWINDFHYPASFNSNVTLFNSFLGSVSNRDNLILGGFELQSGIQQTGKFSLGTIVGYSQALNNVQNEELQEYLNFRRQGQLPEWRGINQSNWTDTASWTGNVPNSSIATALFRNALNAGNQVTLDASQTINNLTFKSANAYSISGPTASVLSLAGTNPTINVTTLNGGTQTIGSSLILGDNTAIKVEGGTLAFALPLGATSIISTNVTAIIGPGDTLQLGGYVSALGTASGNKAKITTGWPTSTLKVSGTGQVVGRVSGPNVLKEKTYGFPYGQTIVEASSDLTVDGLRQNKLSLKGGSVLVPTKLSVANHGGSNGLVVLNNLLQNSGTGMPGLVLGNNSILDVHDNDVVLYYTGNGADPNPTLTIQGYIDNFYRGVTGVPVIASQGIIDSGGQTVFVAINNGVTGFGDDAVMATFYDLILGNSTAGTGFNQTIVRYTWGGDYDLNGVVDALDYAIVDTNLGQIVSGGGGAGWQRGDGDFDGMVTALDYAPIDTNLGKGGGGWADQRTPSPNRALGFSARWPRSGWGRWGCAANDKL